MSPLTREDLDRMWAAYRVFVESGLDATEQFEATLRAERAFADRVAQANAIRWAAKTQSNGAWSAQNGYSVKLFDLAHCVEHGQLEVTP